MTNAATPVRTFALAGALALTLTASASADKAAAGGGYSSDTPTQPQVTALACAGDGTAVCARGATLSVRGQSLKTARSVVFLGGRGTRDDRRARPRHRDEDEVTVAVPASAKSGRVRVVADSGSATGPRVTVKQPAAARVPAPAIAVAAAASAPAPAPAPTAVSAGAAGVFPIQGAHDLGQTATNGFGGGRGHQGQDMFAACGTPLVAARGGQVTKATFQDRAGNYVVITDPSGESQAYMHMQGPALVTEGATVATGQPIGQVGDSGAASGCHLHFELWTAPGWYQGGTAVDPLPLLRQLDAQS